MQKNFDKYEIPGLDSVQYITDNGNPHYDLVQLTLSDAKYFNADVMHIPSELIDNLPSAMAAATKYSQTQEGFEKECPDISYEETYHNADEAEYSECSAAFEPLGDTRTDDEIGEVMYAAAGNIEKDLHEYDSYMHAVDVLDESGTEGLKGKVEERYISDLEWEENERNEIDTPEYADLEL